MTMSSSALARSTPNLYWKPEQPPPSTLTRSMEPCGSLLRISPIRRAARSLTVTFTSIDRPLMRDPIGRRLSRIVKCAGPAGQCGRVERQWRSKPGAREPFMPPIRAKAGAGAGRAGQPDPQRVPARLRPHHPFQRVPAAGAQDAGVRLSRGRPLPHPAHPYARSRPDRPLAGARARARRGPRRGAGAGARSRPSAVRPRRRARARRGAEPVRRLRSQRAGAAHRHRAGAPLRRLRRAQSHLGDAGGPGQAQRPAHRPRRPAGRPLRRARRAGGDPRLRANPGSGAVVASPSAEAQVAALADDIAYDAHDIDDGLRADLFTLDDIAAVAIIGDIVREIDAAISRPRAGAARARDGAPPDHPHDRGRHRRDRPARRGAQARLRRATCASGAGRWWRFRRRWKKPTPTSRASCCPRMYRHDARDAGDERRRRRGARPVRPLCRDARRPAGGMGARGSRSPTKARARATSPTTSPA